MMRHPTPPPRPRQADSRTLSPGGTPIPALSTLLAAVLSSEDALFRDPFAEFHPSGR